MRKKIVGFGISILATMSCCYAQYKASPSDSYHIAPIQMQSRWAHNVNPENALKEYPRPQLQRKNWITLNGLWEYCITDSSATTPTVFQGNILVPYPIESALSGVEKKLLPDQILWYQKKINRPIIDEKDRLILNFGAVDWKTTVFINDRQVGTHYGGYLSFSFDVTDYLNLSENTILVKVYDPSDKGPNSHGKQVLNPENIYYTPSSGIWQTVWLEKVPHTYISKLKTTPDIDKGELNIDVTTIGKLDNNTIEVTASENGLIISKTKIPITKNTQSSVITIPNAKLWSPDNPFLYDLSVKILEGKKPIDEIKSYFGMRKINIQKDNKGADRIFLNNMYTYNLGTLDQGFWPEGLYTAPTDEALAFDIKTIKSLGFNTIRKHIKIEPERWYYHADKIGVLVWQDFVNPPQGLPEGSRSFFEKEVQETMEQLHNHPSIVTWVLFNERWGAYDQERLTKWIKAYDPSRIVNGHSGELLYVDNQLREPATAPWIGSDIVDVHSYPNPRTPPSLPNKAKVIGEFGGIGVSVPFHEWDDIQGWGYIKVSPADLKRQYVNMMSDLKKLETEGLSASIYTQPFDVEGEENGLLTYDREIIKIPVNELRNIHQQFVNQTSGFALDTNFIIATNINTNDTDDRYQDLLHDYEKNKHDSSFLRRLTLMSIRKKDQAGTTMIGNSYIDILTDPFSKENLLFILKITKSSKDKGFEILWKQSQKVDSILWKNASYSKVKAIITAEEITPYNDKPNWEEIQNRTVKKYGAIGEELVFGKQMIYYAFEANPKDWKKFSKYYVLYFEKALPRSEYHINNMTWLLYENENNPKTLEFALNIMKTVIEKWDQSPEAYDTYANLLHKLNKTPEAIKWEEKAVQLKKGAPDEKLYTDALQKMKAGLPTWPQTQNN